MKRGNQFGVGFFNSGGIPYKSDLNFQTEGRSGLTMVDAVGGNNVTILTPTFKTHDNGFGLASTGGVLERLFDGNSYTVYFKIKQVDNLPAGVTWPFGMGNASGVERGFAFYTIGQNWYTTFADGSHNSEAIQVTSCDTNFKGAGWIEVFIQIDFAAKRARCNLYKLSDGSAVGSAINYNISSWTFNDDNNNATMHIVSSYHATTDLKKFLGLKTIAQCRDASYITDVQFYHPTIVDGTDVSGNDHHLSFTYTPITYLDKYYSNVSTYLLDYGYSLYRSTWKYVLSYGDVYIPNNPLGQAIVRTINDPYPTAMVKIEDHEGSLTSHNLAESKLTITGSSWNKSSTTIFEDIVRSSIYYDVTNTYSWHISELDYLLFSQHCKTNHKGTNFFKITDNSLTSRKFLTEIFSYTADKTNTDNILRYTKDYQAVNATLKLSAVTVAGATGKTVYLPITSDGVNKVRNIYWGDGSKSEFISILTMASYLHTYSASGTYSINVGNPETISGLDFIFNTTEYANLSTPNNYVNEFDKCININKHLNLQYLTCSGSINGLSKSLEYLGLYGTAIGDITPFSAIKYLYLGAPLTGLMNKNTTPNLITADFGAVAGLVITIDVTDMTTLKDLDSYAPNSFLTGDVTNSGIKHICWGQPNEIWGDLTGHSDYEYLDISNTDSHYSHIIMDVTNLTHIWKLGSYSSGNRISGSLNNLINLELFWVYGNNNQITKPTTVINSPLLCYFNGSAWAFTSSEINQILADIKTNKNAAKRFPNQGFRHFILNGAGSGAPTGQGITDKAYLQNYSSPTPPGTAELWTIDTN